MHILCLIAYLKILHLLDSVDEARFLSTQSRANCRGLVESLLERAFGLLDVSVQFIKTVLHLDELNFDLGDYCGSDSRLSMIVFDLLLAFLAPIACQFHLHECAIS